MCSLVIPMLMEFLGFCCCLVCVHNSYWQFGSEMYSINTL